MSITKQAESFFRRAAAAWTRGVGGVGPDGRPVPANEKSANMALHEKECERLHAQAEAILRPLGIVVDYPGMYPMFEVQGREYVDLSSAIQATMANAFKVSAFKSRKVCQRR